MEGKELSGRRKTDKHPATFHSRKIIKGEITREAFERLVKID